MTRVPALPMRFLSLEPVRFFVQVKCKLAALGRQPMDSIQNKGCTPSGVLCFWLIFPASPTTQQSPFYPSPGGRGKFLPALGQGNEEIALMTAIPKIILREMF